MQLKSWGLVLLCALALPLCAAATPETAAAETAATAAPEPATAVTRAANTVVIGVHNFPPDFVLSSDGNHCGGEGVELTRSIMASAGLMLETRCVMPARMYLLLEKGEIDLTINIKSTKALASVPAPVFVEPPYMALQLVLYSHKKTSQAPHDDSVAAIRAFDYQGQRQQLIAQGHQFVDVADAPRAIEIFLHQRTEHLLTYEGPFRAYLQSHDPTVLNQLERRAVDHIPAFFVVSPKSPLQARIVAAIEHYASARHCRYLRSCKAR